MATRMPDSWTRDQLLVAFNLYCKIPFSKTKASNPAVLEVANLIGRSPSSVAMKLGNFGSFDLALREKGIRGLSRASKADRKIWEEFNHDWAKLSLESEIASEVLRERNRQLHTRVPSIGKGRRGRPRQIEQTLKGPSERLAEVKVRLHQRFFRSAVLASYGIRCCICANPIPELLAAGHIIPWSIREDLRANPRNGLCLCSLHHESFDYGFWSVDDKYKVILSEELKAYLPNEVIEVGFVQYAETPVRMPDKFLPEPEYFAYHRRACFRG